MRRIYMDANATTPVLPEVLDAMRPFWSEEFGNASSIHQQGQHARAAVDRARESVAALLNCRAAEIVFTSGGTESDNMGSLRRALAGRSPDNHLEHRAPRRAARREELEARGIKVTFLPCTPEGLIEVRGARGRAPARTRSWSA
jgi:cysteine desulfurase